jgi:NAD(P)H-quinone oxidoreductase subunit I
VMDPHELPAGSRRAGKLPQEIIDAMPKTEESKAEV